MKTTISWPFGLEMFGGKEVLAQRVIESQKNGHGGKYVSLETATASRLKAQFIRNDMICRLEFKADRGDSLTLVTGSVNPVAKRRRYPYISINSGRESAGRIGVAFDGIRGYMIGFDRGGTTTSMALPFSAAELKTVPMTTKRSYCCSGATLASFSGLLAIALAVTSDTGLEEIRAIHEQLCRELDHEFDRVMQRHELVLGAGNTILPLHDFDSFRL